MDFNFAKTPHVMKIAFRYIKEISVRERDEFKVIFMKAIFISGKKYFFHLKQSLLD
jgi:hypothetical protein